MDLVLKAEVDKVKQGREEGPPTTSGSIQSLIEAHLQLQMVQHYCHQITHTSTLKNVVIVLHVPAITLAMAVIGQQHKKMAMCAFKAGVPPYHARHRFGMAIGLPYKSHW